MKLFDGTEITSDELIRNWNTMGDKLKEVFLDQILKIIESDNDISLHNYFVWYVNELLGDQGGEFKKQVAILIENLSLRNIEHGKKNKGTT